MASIKNTGVAYCTVLIIILVVAYPANSTALDDYLAIPDANYTKPVYPEGSFDFSTWTTGYVLRMTSQGWRDPCEVTPHIWQHWVTVIVPGLDLVLGPTKDTALIYITDGNSYDPAPEIDPQLRNFAAGTRSVVVQLFDVPNQPLYFSDEAFWRSEDEIIAYSWDKFLNGADANWPVQLPMVKSVIRCMDMVQEFVGSSDGPNKTIEHFVLAGGSKRGWTAWLAAATDPNARVTAVAPIVSDLLNMKYSFAHHWAAYGFWADALEPYEQLGIFEWFDDPRVTELLQIVDPYQYRDRLDIPKFLINAAGDDFFVSDSSRFYIGDFSEETYIRIVPNTDHYLTDAFDSVFNSMVPYYNAFLNDQARPDFSWMVELDGTITVDVNDEPNSVFLWSAVNEYDRDFRLVTTGPVWQSQQLTEQAPGVYLGQVAEPEFGWVAYFVELVYDNSFADENIESGDFRYRFTTEMMVLPEMLPFEADFDHDRFKNASDLQILSNFWLSENQFRDISPRRNRDGIITLEDFAVFSGHWLE